MAKAKEIVVLTPQEIAIQEWGENFKKNLAPQMAGKRALYELTVATASKLKVVDAASLAVANDLARDILVELDAFEAIRLAGPGALNKVVMMLNREFKPLRDMLESAAAGLKREIGAHVQGERDKQVTQYQAAAAAHQQGDHGAAQQSLAIASAADTSAPTGTNTREVWEVESYDLTKMTLQFLQVDEVALNKFAREHDINQQPVVAGVVFKKKPVVSIRRNS